MRVIIVDRHLIVRVGLRVVLAQAGDIQVVGEASTRQGALALVALEQPEVIIIDLNLPDGCGLSMVPALVAAAPALRVLLLSAHDDPDIARHSIAAGVHGYLSKAALPDALILAVRSIAGGRTFLSLPVESAGLYDALAYEAVRDGLNRQRSSVAQRLSGRERQVLELFARGYTHRQIADTLGLRAKTIETYRSRLGDKFGVRSRAELVDNARQMGLLAARESSSAD
jgi:DNA-binding NarL/FixJ family response regulator